MDISYDYYRIFYFVARHGNLTQAARALMSNQPNLTRAIKALESALGCPLFIRTNRGMVLTPEGERLYAHVRIAFDHIESGEAEIRQSLGLEKGCVYVASSELALHCALLPVLKKYRELYPGIQLKISNHSTPQAIDAIKDGIADIAVVTTPIPASSTLTHRTLKKFREVAVCSDAFPELLHQTVTFADLLNHPTISLGTQTKSFELYSEFFAREGLNYHPETEVATADQILPMVQANLGIGFVPKSFLKGVRGVSIIQTEKPLPERAIKIIKRKDQSLSVAARAMESLLIDLQSNCP